MTRTPRPLPPLLSARPFHVHEAFAHDITPSRLRAADLEQPFPGVRVAKTLPATLENWFRACSLALPDNAAFSHLTAAQLWHIPLPRRYEQTLPLHVTTPNEQRPLRLSQVSGHRGRSALATHSIRGLPVCSPVDTWLGLARWLTCDELVAAADYLICDPLAEVAATIVPGHRRPLATQDQLAQAVADGSRMIGIRQLRAALPLIRPGVESPRETQLRLMMLRAGLPEPEINTAVFDSAGRLLGVLDLFLRAFRVGIEYEGAHHRGPEQFAADLRRYERFTASGILVVRIDAPAMRDDGAEAVARITDALLSRGWRPN
jgi:hypothetical protein